MRRIVTLLVLAACGIVLPGLAADQLVSPKRSEGGPNVVLIISDDHGWEDYGFMGHPHIKTPNLDKLAAGGLTFPRGYVPTSLCRPSLASIMTGLYPHQHKITGNDPPGNPKDPANRQRMVQIFQKSRTLAGILGSSGYVSHQSGKWWEGECRCCGFTQCMTHGDVARGGRHGDEGLKIGRESMQPIYDFIDGAGDRPFFVWYAPFLPHTPHNPPDRLLKQYVREGRPEPVANYYAMVSWLDETVGDLVGYLEKKGVRENTLIVYLADNGWVQGPRYGQRALFESRAKLSPYDTGLRTPILVSWPRRVKPHQFEQTLTSSIDIVPTVLAATGAKSGGALPGVNLLDEKALAERKALFGSIFVHTSIDIQNPVRNLKYRWMVEGDWKLIVPHRPNRDLLVWDNLPGVSGWGTDVELYNLTRDPQETTNVAASYGELVERLVGALDAWWEVPE